MGANPDQLLALKKADADFAIQMKALGVKVEELAYGDTKDARSMAVSLAGLKSPLAWGALMVSMIVMGIFTSVMMGWAPAPDAGSQQLLYAAVTLTIGYWLGSSAGSARKDSSGPFRGASR